MKKLSLILVSVLALVAVACGDDDDDGGGSGSCDKAEEVLEGCDNGSEITFDNCSPQAAEFAQCIVDHPDAACGDTQASDFEEYSKCAQDAVQ